MATTEASSQALQQVLCFALAGEAYALPILKVREIQAQATITRIPKAPPYMPGVINLRGAIVPILELRHRFSLGAPPEDTRPVIVIVEALKRTLGIRVDSVSDVLDLDPSSIRPAPEPGQPPWSLGLGHHADPPRPGPTALRWRAASPRRSHRLRQRPEPGK